MTIERNYNIAFIASLALREKQIQQIYRPVIAVHKWFARRPGTLFRGLLLSEFGDRPVEDLYYKANQFPSVSIADPFMGGGTPLLEGNRLGCHVVGADINPMAAWIVREEIDEIDLAAYASMGTELTQHLTNELGYLYRTRCRITGQPAIAKYFLYVKVGSCSACASDFDLFPGYVLAEDARHPFYVLVCHACGELNEVDDPSAPGSCTCGVSLTAEGPVKRNKCKCPHCGHTNTAPFQVAGVPKHRLFAIEYFNPDLRDRPGRLFKKPDEGDFYCLSESERLWGRLRPQFIPEASIPAGDESSRLHRWGYQRYHELFNTRQLVGLETSARFIAAVQDIRLRRALATNLSDLLRYQNMLCRYDTMALKSLDVFSIHGFPVGYIQVESNLIGIRNGGGLPVGSGGWLNIIAKYHKAKRFCSEPFEVRVEGKRKYSVPISGESIGAQNPSSPAAPRRSIDLRCQPAAEMNLRPHSLDAVFTDPPYFGMVQYGELMEFCYVWLRKVMGQDFPGLESTGTRHAGELTGNATAARDLVHFAEGLAAIFRRMADALKPGAPLVFTYHHNQQEAYLASGVAILDAGLTCSASLPCPAEMSGSIHIHGTESSIVDTVFVCRETGNTSRTLLFSSRDELTRVVEDDLAQLRASGMKPTAGDIRCIALGHLTRMAIWNLRGSWQVERPMQDKLALFRAAMDGLACVDELKWGPTRVRALPAVAQDDLFAQPRDRDLLDAVAF